MKKNSVYYNFITNDIVLYTGKTKNMMTSLGFPLSAVMKVGERGVREGYFKNCCIKLGEL